MSYNKTGTSVFISIICWIFMLLLNTAEVTAAVPIDIVTETPGHTYKPIIPFIPDKKPLISRRYRRPWKPDHPKYWNKPWDRPRYDYYYDERYKHKYPNRDWWKHAEKHGNWYRVKYQDSHYVDDLEVPFLMANFRHKVPSVGHGVDIKFGQLKPIINRMVVKGMFRNDVMDAVKRWQYANRHKNWWKRRYRHKLIQGGLMR